MTNATISVFTLAVGSILLAGAATSYDWPGVGETLIVEDGQSLSISSAEDVSAVSALGAIQLGTGSQLTYDCADATLNLTASLSGAGTFKAKAGQHLNLLEDASALTGCFDIDSTPTCVSNRFGLGSSASKTAKIVRGTVPDVNFLTFGGAGLTNDVPLEINSCQKDASGSYLAVGTTTCGWNVTLDECTAPCVMNGKVTLVRYPYILTDDAVFGGGLDCTSGTIDYRTRNRKANTVVISNVFRSANAAIALQSFTGGTAQRFDPTFVLACTNFNATSIDLRRATIRCAATNVFNASSASFFITTKLGKYDGAYNDGNIDLNGYDQTIRRLKVGYAVTESDGAKYYNTMMSAKPAVMTLLSSEDDTVPYIFTGNLSLRFAGTGAFRLANVRSTSTGTLRVDSGTLQLKWDAEWAGTNVVVTGGTLQLDSSYSLLGYRADVSVTGGKIAVGASAVVRVKSLTVNGTALASNRSYTQSDLEELGYGDYFDIAAGNAIEVDVHEIVVTDHTWSGASATSAYLDDAENWSGTAPNLTDGSARLIFGSGLKAPVIRSDATVHSLVFSSDTDTQLSSENNAKLTVRGGGVTMTRATAAEGVTTNVITAPIAFSNSEEPVWSVAENVHLRLAGPLSGSPSTYRLLLCGPGTLEITGDNSALERQLIVSNFTYAAFLHPYALGAPTRSSTLWKLPSMGGDCRQRYVFEGDGLTNRVPFLFDTWCVQNDYAATKEPTWTHAGRKFVCYGKFGITSGSTTIFWDDAEFHGGLVAVAGSIFFSANGLVSFLDTPIDNASGGWFNLASSTLPEQCVYRFGVSGNKWSQWYFTAYRCTLLCDADNALCEKCDLQLGAGLSTHSERVYRRWTTLDLNGHDQTVQTICPVHNLDSVLNWDVAKGDPEYVTVTSSVPATITLTSGAYGYLVGLVSTNSIRFRGAAGMRFAGPYGFTFLNHVSDTTGTLEVDSGRVSIEYNAGWNGPVRVTGGTLAIAADAAETAFTRDGRHVSANAVTLAGGTLELPSCDVKVRDLIVTALSDQPLPMGYYGSSTCADPRVPAENRLSCLSGEGVLRVLGRPGLMLLIR